MQCKKVKVKMKSQYYNDMLCNIILSFRAIDAFENDFTWTSIDHIFITCLVVLEYKNRAMNYWWIFQTLNHINFEIITN